jgi:hypothetical protein
MIVVAIVIIAYTWDPTTAGMLIALLAAGDYVAVAMIIIASIVKSVLEMLIIKLFVKAVGLDAALIVAVLLAMYGMYSSFDLKSSTGVLDSTASAVKGAPWSSELLKISTGITKGIGTEIGGLMENLTTEASDFQKETTKQLELLETAQKLLEGNNLLSPFVFFGETPDAFYNRTVHASNIGLMGITAITNYVDIALTLPKLQQTVGDYSYA